MADNKGNKMTIPSNSAAFVPAKNISKKPASPKKTTGGDLRAKGSK